MNAVIVGGQTVRRDNPPADDAARPKVATRSNSHVKDAGTFREIAAMWDVSVATTHRRKHSGGANRPMQDFLIGKGVQVVEFDFLTPEAVSKYCQQRGFPVPALGVWRCAGSPRRL